MTVHAESVREQGNEVFADRVTSRRFRAVEKLAPGTEVA